MTKVRKFCIFCKKHEKTGRKFAIFDQEILKRLAGGRRVGENREKVELAQVSEKCDVSHGAVDEEGFKKVERVASFTVNQKKSNYNTMLMQKCKKIQQQK